MLIHILSFELEEAVGDIYEGEDMDLFDDPDEVPVASHGFDFLQEGGDIS